MLLQALCIISKPSVYSNWSYSPETLNLGQNWWFFCPVWPWIQTDDPEKQQGTCSMLLRGLCIISKPSVNSNWSYSLETLNSGQNWQFVSCVTLKFDGWYKTRQIWGIWKLRPAYSPETPNLGQFRWCFVPCDLEIWWMTLENNRASLLCCFKLCATFHSHWWIQTGVTVRKRPIRVKFDDF